MSTAKGKFVSAFQSMQMLGDYSASDLIDDTSKKGSEITNNRSSVTKIKDFKSVFTPNVISDIHNGDELYNPLDEVDNLSSTQNIDMEIVSDNEKVESPSPVNNPFLSLTNNKPRNFATIVSQNEPIFPEDDQESLSDTYNDSSSEKMLKEKKTFSYSKKAFKSELLVRGDAIDDNDELLGTALAELEEEEREEKEQLAKKFIEEQKGFDKQKKKKKKKNKEKLKAKDERKSKKKKKKKSKLKNKSNSSDDEKLKKKKEKKKEKMPKEQKVLNALPNDSLKINSTKGGVPLENTKEAKVISKDNLRYRKKSKEKDTKKNVDRSKDHKYSSQRKSPDSKEREVRKRSSTDHVIQSNHKRSRKDSDDKKLLYKNHDSRKDSPQYPRKDDEKQIENKKHKRVEHDILVPEKKSSYDKHLNSDRLKIISPLDPNRSELYKKQNKAYESKRKSESESEESDNINTKKIPQRNSFLENYSKELSKYRAQHSVELNNSQLEISSKHNLASNFPQNNQKSRLNVNNIEDSLPDKTEPVKVDTNVSKSTYPNLDNNSFVQKSNKDTLPSEIILKDPTSPSLVKIDEKNTLLPCIIDKETPEILPPENVLINSEQIVDCNMVKSKDVNKSDTNSFTSLNTQLSDKIMSESGTVKLTEESDVKKTGALSLHDYQKRKQFGKFQEQSASRASTDVSSNLAQRSPDRKWPNSNKENMLTSNAKGSNNDAIEAKDDKSFIPLLTDDHKPKENDRKSTLLSDEECVMPTFSDADDNSPYNPEVASPIDISSPPSPSAAAIEDEKGVNFAVYREVIAFEDIMKSKVKHEARKHKKRKLEEMKGESENKPKLVDYLLRQAKVEEEMKAVLKSYFKNKEITKDEYKNILKKAVPQVTMSDSPIIPEKIQSLMTKFVRKCKGQRLKEDKTRRKQRKELEEQQRQLELQIQTSNAVINSFQQIRVLNPNLPMPPVINL